MTISYTLGIPDGPHNPSNDQPNMKANNDAIDAIIAIDHVSFNVNNSGYHTIIHETTQTTASTVSGINQIFSGVPGVLNVNSTLTTAIPPGGDTQLFTLTGMGGLSQMTGNKAATNGYVWCAGILIQWGIVNGTHGSSNVFNGGDTGNVTFSIANVSFPNNCFTVFLQPNWKSNVTSLPTSQATFLTDTFKLSKTQFSWGLTTSSVQLTSFYWYAVGN